MTYRGRFAPTPSGPLHFGSIIAALGSYLQAKINNGKWLVRIDDIDQARAKKNADKIILEQLESLGLLWDEEIEYQSQNIDTYETALNELEELALIFPCRCSRKDLSNMPYPGTCREARLSKSNSNSIRIITDKQTITLTDKLQGEYSQTLETDIGDFIIKRADGYFSYHLASVIDDAKQNITEIVRGIDLLDSTPRQIYLQQKLNLITPTYLHLPIAINSEGKKISKSTEVESRYIHDPNIQLFNALVFLGQCPPEELRNDTPVSILEWAEEKWNIDLLPQQKEIVVTQK